MDEKNKNMHKRLHFGYHCSEQESVKYRKLINFLKTNGEENETESAYGLIKYLLDFCSDLLYDENMIELRNMLYTYKKIKKKSLKEAFRYALLFGKLSLKEAFDELVSEYAASQSR